jgi:hypothetical protein
MGLALADLRDCRLASEDGGDVGITAISIAGFRRLLWPLLRELGEVGSAGGLV